MNPLEEIINYLESRKAEILLKEQNSELSERLSDRINEVAYDNIPDDECVEKDGRIYVSEVDNESITWEAQGYIIRTYVRLQNLINLLKSLRYDDFDPEYLGATITINRRPTFCGETFHKVIIDSYADGLKEISGRAPYIRDLTKDEIEECGTTTLCDYDLIDWENLDKPKINIIKTKSQRRKEILKMLDNDEQSYNVKLLTDKDSIPEELDQSSLVIVNGVVTKCRWSDPKKTNLILVKTDE